MTATKFLFIQRMALEALDDAESAIYTLGVTLRDLGWDGENGPVQELRVMLEKLQTIRHQAKRGLDRTTA